MDIIIRNGVIQEKESKRIHEIKNNAGLLKKNFDDYIPNSVGPYYDLKNCHLCIPRKYNQIKNFIGPQDPYMIKLVEFSEYNKKASYCSICHREMKPNPAFSGKRKIFVDDNYFEKKKEIVPCVEEIEDQIKKIKLTEDKDQEKKLEKVKESFNTTESNIDIEMKFEPEINEYLEKEKHLRIVNKFYKMVYKLLKQPILYHISFKETKLIWPWELTNYQKLRLECPNYKFTCSFYSHLQHSRITEKYVIIE